MIKTIFFALFVSTLVILEPFIKKQIKNDHFLDVHVRNPLNSSVEVELDCGGDVVTHAKGIVKANKTVVFRMESDIKGHLDPGDCIIFQWKSVKK